MEKQMKFDKFTCKSYEENDAPALIALSGDKKNRPEPAQHIIEFPGGAIELSRTSDGGYWAHVIVNHDQAIDDCDGLNQCFGDIVGSRIDYDHPANPNVVQVPNMTNVRQIAILIKPRRSNG